MSLLLRPYWIARLFILFLVDLLVSSVQVARAGHPAPLLVRDGEITGLGTPGPLLGHADQGGSWTVDDVTVSEGDGFVLYTDGVLDTVGEHERFGDARLRAAMGRNGRDYVRRNYRWDIVISKFERLFAKLRNAR